MGAGLVVVVSVIAVSLYAAVREPAPIADASVLADRAMIEVAPDGVLDAAEVPPALEAHYQSAQLNYETFEQVPCFCGCEEMLGHRHLGDCFVRSDGGGLEAHALGCGVCLGEAQQVTELVAEGVTDSDQIRRAVIAEWGDPYQTGS